MDRFDFNSFMDNLHKKNFGKRFFMFVMGMLISALAFNLFSTSLIILLNIKTKFEF